MTTKVTKESLAENIGAPLVVLALKEMGWWL